jgi:hypothetical protein
MRSDKSSVKMLSADMKMSDLHSGPETHPSHEQLDSLLRQLPADNRAVVLKMIDVFYAIVVTHVKATQMDVRNLSVCIAQSLCRKSEGSELLLLNATPLLTSLVVEKDLVFFTGSRGGTVKLTTGEGASAKTVAVAVDRPVSTLKSMWGHGQPLENEKERERHRRMQSRPDAETAIVTVDAVGGGGLADAGISKSPRGDPPQRPNVTPNPSHTIPTTGPAVSTHTHTVSLHGPCLPAATLMMACVCVWLSLSLLCRACTRAVPRVVW